LLVAVAPDKSAAGYIAYRIAKNRAAVTHLTTNTKHRGHGAAGALIDALKRQTKNLSGISARCRRDYGLTDMWSGFGFAVRHTKEGRGADRALLDYWWYDHGHLDLFSFGAAQEEESDAALVAMDANVFFDLINANRPQGEDSKVLLA